MSTLSPLSIDSLLDCFANYAKAKDNHDRAREDYEGYSWGYHGGRHVDAVNSARADCAKALDEYIALCVQRKIEEVGR